MERLWMGARSMRNTWASWCGEPKGYLWAHGCVHSYFIGGGTRDMGVAGGTVGLEDMDMEGPETVVAARVLMTSTQEIRETIMITEMRHAHLM